MELLNCPFCGGEAFVNFDELGDTNLAHVMCSECWVAGPERDDGTEQAAWNTRTPDPAQAELLAEAVEALDGLIAVAAKEAANYRSCADLPDGSIPDESDRAFIENIEGIVSRARTTLARIKESTDE